MVYDNPEHPFAFSPTFNPILFLVYILYLGHFIFIKEILI